MENNHHKDALEAFITAAADNQKLYASDRVWQNINQQVQPKCAWPALTIVAIVLLLAISITTFLHYPSNGFVHPSPTSKKMVAPKRQPAQLPAAIIAAASLPDKSLAQVFTNTTPFCTLTFVGKPTTEKFIPAFADQPATVPLLINLPSLATANTVAINPQPLSIQNIVVTVDALIENEPSPTVETKQPASFAALNSSNKLKNTRWSYEMYTAPSIGYFNMANDGCDKELPSPTATNLYTANNKSKPLLGVEVGMGLQYHLSNKILFKTGLQFNVQQYLTDAGNAFSNSDVLPFSNKLNNNMLAINTKLAPSALDARIYQVSVPFGLQWQPITYKYVGFSVAASVQPSITFNKEAYFGNNKQFANSATVLRNLDVNASFNAALSYKLGNAKLYLGPQVRYQHLSNYGGVYFSRDYRFDYGIRFGFVRPL